MMYDVIIVGAGPIGCRTAKLISERGFKTLALEEHRKIGEPIQCTGLVSHRIFRLSGLSDNFVVNDVSIAKFFSRSGHCLELKSRRRAFVIDRRKLDVTLAAVAKNSGAKIETQTRFMRFGKVAGGLRVKTSKGNFNTKLLVGADGPNSTVAKAASIENTDNLLTGLQFLVKDNFDPDSVELWFGSDVSPDFFGWVVPENNREARVGVAASKNVKNYFDSFVRKRFQKKITGKNKSAGLIRCGLIEKSVADNVILVGDAASQVKPFSGGGLIYGLIGAEYAAKACVKALKKETYDQKFLVKNYDRRWKEKLWFPITKGMFIRNMVKNSPDLLFDSFIRMGRHLKPFLEGLDMDLLG